MMILNLEIWGNKKVRLDEIWRSALEVELFSH